MINKEVRLYIAVPSCRDWKVRFGSSFMGLIHNVMNIGLTDRKLTAIYLNAMAGASILSRARQLALNDAIKGGFTHLLMLDDDMTFPGNTVDRLLQHEKPFVAANYCRKVPGEPVSISFDLNGKSIDSAGKTGLEEVMFVGAGLNLIDLEAIKHISPPHFCVVWDEQRQDYWGEDMFFCNKLRSEGIPIFIDHDLSQKVGHVGDYEFRFEINEMIEEFQERMKRAA